jgi:KipI family sensor histidine kinase inhibitor
VVRAAGDSALLVQVGDRIAVPVARRVRALARALAASGIPGLGEFVPGYATLLCTYDPLVTDVARLWRWLAEADPEAAGGSEVPPRRLVVPVCYGGAYGPDLAEVALRHGLSEAEVVRWHSGTTYHVYFLGFSPGFAYMGEVPAAIATPRRATPRTRVPAGSVAIGGAQTGVYPTATPGGWHLLGRTPLVVYDPAAAEPALFRPGDEVTFQPIAAADFAALAAAAPAASPAAATGSGRPVLRVIRPGSLTTIQDLGRGGHQAAGIPVAGAADVPALRLANRLLGNPDGAAALEITVLGPHLVALADVALAVVGGDLGAQVDGQPVAPGASFLLRRGQELRFLGPRAGCRAYLAVAGGVEAPLTLGSRSCDLLGGLGPRPLAAGDTVCAGEPAAPDAALAGRRLRPGAYELPRGPEVAVAVVPGPQDDWFAEGERLYGAAYHVLPASDRTGLRLDGPPLHPRGQELLSEATPLGAIQVPADGRPIVLLAGRQTVGGYPKIGVVATHDAWRLAQLRPGAVAVRFVAVDLAEAHRRYRAAEAALADAVAG